MSGFRNVPPRASSMIEALRGMGYSTATALADIIDNSISANAKRIGIDFRWSGVNSSVVLRDDGDGMTDADLERAMRLGDKSPLSERCATDLGRFGLGLKTASFSQCRRLTVASKSAGGPISCLHWDLDELASREDHEWHLLEGCPANLKHDIDDLLHEVSGTIVCWDKMDRIVPPGAQQQDFLDLIDVVEQHIAMVFHRFLEPTESAIRIELNGKPILPWDPFLTEHPSTWSSSTVPVASSAGTIRVRSHVLPHKDRLDEGTYKSAGGPEGWTAQQGFYVYRNGRLLVSGSWLGLGQGRAWTKEEAHRLARICVEIPNTADAAWKIDIRKSVARPPIDVRPHLLKIAEDARERARRVFAHRGQAVRASSGRSVAQVWRADQTSKGLHYSIDQAHPVVKAVLDDSGPQRAAIELMLRVIEETVPVQRIWLDTTESRETPQTGFTSAPPAELQGILRTLFNNLVNRKGYSPEAAVEHLLHTEPFQSYPEHVFALLD